MPENAELDLMERAPRDTHNRLVNYRHRFILLALKQKCVALYKQITQEHHLLNCQYHLRPAAKENVRDISLYKEEKLMIIIMKFRMGLCMLNVDMKEQLDKEINKNHEHEDKLNKLYDERENKITEKSNIDAVSIKKKEECHVLDEKLKTVMVEVDRLSKLVKEEEKLRADLRVCEEKRKMIENEVVVMKRVEQRKVGLEKENVNMKSRADLLREKEESYNEDLAFCKNQEDDMVEKEEQLVIQLKDLEEENTELEKEMAALESVATHAMEEAKMTEAENKKLEEKSLKLMEESQSSAEVLKDIASKEASVSKNLDLESVKTETEQIFAAVASAEEETKLKKEALELVEEKEKEVKRKQSLMETGIMKKLETRQVL